MTLAPQHQSPKTHCRDVFGQRGAVLVEFALVLPLLLLLLLGIFEFGRAFNYWIDQTHLANIGARWAAVDQNPGPGTLQQAIAEQANTQELRDDITVCIEVPPSEEVGDPVEVTVEYGFNWMPFIGEAIDATVTTLTGSATMRLEQRPSEYGNECFGE
jgi:hypothetical protein